VAGAGSQKTEMHAVMAWKWALARGRGWPGLGEKPAAPAPPAWQWHKNHISVLLFAVNENANKIGFSVPHKKAAKLNVVGKQQRERERGERRGGKVEECKCISWRTFQINISVFSFRISVFLYFCIFMSMAVDK